MPIQKDRKRFLIDYRFKSSAWTAAIEADTKEEAVIKFWEQHKIEIVNCMEEIME